MLDKIITFITEDIWRIRLKDLPRGRSIMIRNFRVVLLGIRSFTEDKCQLRAASLTFYTLLSIVPLVAMAFGIATGFGLQHRLEAQLLENLPAQEEVLLQVVNFAKSLLETARGGLIAGVGVFFLFWMVIKVLSNIEKSFNDIWGIKKMRPIGRKLADYLSIMVLCPIFLIASSSIVVFITTHVELFTREIELLGFFSPLILTSLKLLPYLLIWALFCFVYMFMPNTKVNFTSALLAGVVAGTIYVIAQEAYFTFQIGVAKYNAIYGSFAALPLFLIWLKISWLVVLFGAEISFAHQNVETYEFEPDCLRLSYSFKKLLMLHITHHIISRFMDPGTPNNTSAADISHDLEIPIRLVRQLLSQLEEAGVLTSTCEQEKTDPDYLPAKDITDIKISELLQKLEEKGLNRLPLKTTPGLEKLEEVLALFRESLKNSPENALLRTIA